MATSLFQINLVVVKDHIWPALATIDSKASIFGNSIFHCLRPHKVGHGLACIRTERDIPGFRWFEHHVGVAIAIEFACCFACSRNVVTSIEIGLGNTLDGVSPCFLCCANLLFSDRVGWGSLKRHWWVVEKDADLSISILFVAKCVLHLGLTSISSTGKVVGAHGDSDIAVQINLVIVKDHIWPALATTDSKASIFGNSVFHCLRPHEVGHGLACIRTERDIPGFRWFEHHVGVAIAIEFACCFACSRNVITFIEIGLGNTLDGVSPCSLCGANLLFSDWCRISHGWPSPDKWRGQATRGQATTQEATGSHCSKSQDRNKTFWIYSQCSEAKCCTEKARLQDDRQALFALSFLEWQKEMWSAIKKRPGATVKQILPCHECGPMKLAPWSYVVYTQTNPVMSQKLATCDI